MNKLVKAAVAGAAGIALLMGGAGTFALWNSSATVSAGTITAGTLSLTANSDGVWKNGSTTIDPATYKIIPGTTLVYTQTLTVNATGDGLTAGLTYSGMTGSGTLDSSVTKTLAVTSTSPNVTVSGNNVTVVSAATPATVKVTFTVSLPSSATTGQGGTLNLSALTFTLAQTA
jgi:alternate signal-mediated exported protein